MPNSNLFFTLFTAAETYLSLSYSVIPLYGDADLARPKVPAVPWAAYQKAKPSLDECRRWFLDEQFAGIGIVTGAVSRLAVLDFDTPAAFHAFESRFPALAERQVIQTRRGYHLYFQLPPNLRLPSRKGKGVDLLADGCYAVARPTVIDGHAYKLIRGGMPQLLNLSDIQGIQQFLDAYKLPVASCQLPVNKEQPLRSKPQLTNHTVLSTQYSALSNPPTLNPQSFLSRYCYLTGQGEGRNNALFRVALQARDHGLPLEQTIEMLASEHTYRGAVAHHTSESPEMRRCEAIQTIQSAYSRPPRAFTLQPKESGGLPNSVREKLFRLKYTHVVRLWEGLRLKGVEPGTAFTADEAIRLLKGIVGRDTIYNALQATVGQGAALFERLIPSGHPRASGDAAADKKQETPNKCVFGRAKKSGIIQRGPKTRVFIMPAPLDLCGKLGVEPSHSDPITLDDLKSAKTTRMAAHRELIKRRPGTYPRRWLSHRLGVCVESLDTYNREIPINFRPQYIELHISWANIRHVPDGNDIDGTFLEDETGKRYPALRRLAAKLLGQGKSVTYKRQDANYYWYGETPPDVSVLMGFHSRQAELEANLARIQQFVNTYTTNNIEGRGDTCVVPTNNPSVLQLPLMPQDEQGRAIVGTGRALSKVDNHKPPIPKPKREPSGRRALKDEALENLACRVYERINRLSRDATLHISMAVSRKMVSRYSRDVIEKSLRLTEGRRGISKPAGFFIAALRSEAKGTA